MTDAERYREEMGKEPPNLPDDHPDRWQWEYVGRSAEDKKRLRELLGTIDDDEPEQPTQEETLF